MPTPPPRLAPTVALAVLWVALYLLYLSVKPEPPAPPERDGRATTSTSLITRGEDDEAVSPAGAPARAPSQAR